MASLITRSSKHKKHRAPWGTLRAAAMSSLLSALAAGDTISFVEVSPTVLPAFLRLSVRTVRVRCHHQVARAARPLCTLRPARLKERLERTEVHRNLWYSLRLRAPSLNGYSRPHRPTTAYHRYRSCSRPRNSPKKKDNRNDRNRETGNVATTDDVPAQALHQTLRRLPGPGLGPGGGGNQLFKVDAQDRKKAFFVSIFV